MKMDELREVVEIIEKAKIDVLKLEKGDFKLYYQKNGAQGIQINEDQNIEKTDLDNNNEQISTELQSETKNHDEVEKNSEEAFHEITSPIVGAFYSRPKPESEPFVQIGSKIKTGDTVCVLEAMKLLNEVKSDVDGEIVEILVEDEQIIEYGQPLFKVKLSE